MIHRAFLVLALVFVLALIVQQYVLIEYEEFYGTWINKEYPAAECGLPFQPLFGIQKLTFLPDGKVEGRWRPLLDSDFLRTFSYTIADKRSDSNGDIYYRQTWVKHFVYGGERFEELKVYSLCKISNSGNNFEIVFDAMDYPKQIDSSHRSYCIYYRQKWSGALLDYFRQD